MASGGALGCWYRRPTCVPLTKPPLPNHLSHPQSAPYDSPFFSAAPPCPAAAVNVSFGRDHHLYGWDRDFKASCTFDKPPSSRPAVFAQQPGAAPAWQRQRAAPAPEAAPVTPVLLAPAAVTAAVPAPAAVTEAIPAPALAATHMPLLVPALAAPAIKTPSQVSLQAPVKLAAQQGSDPGFFTTASIPSSLPVPTVAAGVVSVAALTRASAMASSIVAEAADRAAQLMRAVDDEVRGSRRRVGQARVRIAWQAPGAGGCVTAVGC
jgi:hypothetical protein